MGVPQETVADWLHEGIVPLLESLGFTWRDAEEYNTHGDVLWRKRMVECMVILKIENCASWRRTANEHEDLLTYFESIYTDNKNVPSIPFRAFYDFLSETPVPHCFCGLCPPSHDPASPPTRINGGGGGATMSKK
jgi:hypothetical protein